LLVYSLVKKRYHYTHEETSPLTVNWPHANVVPPHAWRANVVPPHAWRSDVIPPHAWRANVVPPYHRIITPQAAIEAEWGGTDNLRAACGLPLSTYFSGVKLRWLLDNIPAVKNAVDTGDALVGTIDSWLVWKLTNGATHATDMTNASRTGSYPEIHTCCLSTCTTHGSRVTRAKNVETWQQVPHFLTLKRFHILADQPTTTCAARLGPYLARWRCCLGALFRDHADGPGVA
jgi:hypothetical protein